MPKLLIIEDYHNLRESLRIALQEPGCEVRCAEDAEQGMPCLSKWQPDVIVLDYNLPGMNGLEIIRKIKQIYCYLPARPKIIMLSARMDRELREKAMAVGADWCMGKPFDLDILRLMVAKFLVTPEF